MEHAIYTAGKTWQAEKFRWLRDTVGFNVCARWIDLAPESEFVLNEKPKLWQMCMEDVARCDFVLLYSEEESEEQRGALVEIGAAMALNKPIYAIGKCRSIMPNGISDVAFTHHPLWNWVHDPENLVKGAFYAHTHFSYLKQPKQRRA